MMGLVLILKSSREKMLQSNDKLASFCWVFNSIVTIEVMRAADDLVKHRKLREIINVKERLAHSAFIEITVAHKVILCLPFFGRRVIVSRTRPIEDHLQKIGFGGNGNGAFRSAFRSAFLRRRR